MVKPEPEIIAAMEVCVQPGANSIHIISAMSR